MSQNQPVSGDGFSTTDFLNTNPALNRMIKLFLHKRKMSYKEISEKIEALPEDKRLSREELDDTLKSLIEMAWLETTEEDGVLYYTVNMKSKIGTAAKQDPQKMANMDFETEEPGKVNNPKQSAINMARDLWQSLGGKPEDKE
jgi:hypothetical protein